MGKGLRPSFTGRVLEPKISNNSQGAASPPQRGDALGEGSAPKFHMLRAGTQNQEQQSRRCEPLSKGGLHLGKGLRPSVAGRVPSVAGRVLEPKIRNNSEKGT